MTKKPYISVVIPTYNRAAYITEAIESVINQKNNRWPIEIIVIDDGSTDNTKELVEEFKEVRYVLIPHSGKPAVPRNVGVRLARGELIAFQDSDDLWDTNKLVTQIPYFEDPEIILAYGNAEIMDEDGSKTGRLILPKGMGVSGNVFDTLVNENIISTLTVIARKKAIMRAGGFDESNSLRAVEDYHLWLRLSLIGKFKYIEKVLAYYRMHSQNISPKQTIVAISQLIKLFRLLSSELPKQRKTIHKRQARLHRDYINLAKPSPKPFSKIAILWHNLRSQ